jgi:predicted Zn-dependent protease with MMP-like domain
LLTRCEALLDADNRKPELLDTLLQLPSGPFTEAGFHVRAGECFRVAGRLKEAESHFRSALTLDPRSADALHGIGLIHQERGDTTRMIEAWLEVRQLDLELPPFPWSIPADDFANAAEAALADIPEQTRRHFENLPILATDYPAAELIEDGVDPRSLGIITGAPHSGDHGLRGSGAEIACIQLYQRNIERIAQNREEVLEEIRITVLHETGHYFGLSDEDLEDIGLG